MEFKQLEAFVAVVEYNSFSEAARETLSYSAHSQRPYTGSGNRIKLPPYYPQHTETFCYCKGIPTL